jgi:hypothetical protein
LRRPLGRAESGGLDVGLRSLRRHPALRSAAAHIQARSGGHAAASRIDLHLDLYRRLRSAAAGSRLGLTLLDASRPIDEVEADVRAWIIRLTSGSN